MLKPMSALEVAMLDYPEGTLARQVLDLEWKRRQLPRVVRWMLLLKWGRSWRRDVKRYIARDVGR